MSGVASFSGKVGEQRSGKIQKLSPERADFGEVGLLRALLLLRGRLLGVLADFGEVGLLRALLLQT